MFCIFMYTYSICAYFALRNSKLHHVYCGEFAARRRAVLICCNLQSSICTMPGIGKRVKSIAKIIIYNVYKYFVKESAKRKYRGSSN